MYLLNIEWYGSENSTIFTFLYKNIIFLQFFVLFLFSSSLLPFAAHLVGESLFYLLSLFILANSLFKIFDQRNDNDDDVVEGMNQ